MRRLQASLKAGQHFPNACAESARWRSPTMMCIWFFAVADRQGSVGAAARQSGGARAVPPVEVSSMVSDDGGFRKRRTERPELGSSERDFERMTRGRTEKRGLRSWALVVL